MNYLQLAQRLQQKAGISGSAMTTAQSQTGEAGRITAWIDEAYVDIQEVSASWMWMRSTVSFSTVQGQYSYTPAQCGVTDFANWKTDSFRRYTTSVGVRSEFFLGSMPYDKYRDTYIFGNMRLTQGIPVGIAVGPDMSLNLGLIPDTSDYTIVGEYFKEPSHLSADADIPNFPQRYHLLIVYRAMMMYGMYESATEVYQEGKSLYDAMLRRMTRDQLDDVTAGAALA